MNFKFILTGAADRAYIVCRQIFKLGSRGDAIVRITFGFIVDPSAYSAYILFHSRSLLWENSQEGNVGATAVCNLARVRS